MVSATHCNGHSALSDSWRQYARLAQVYRYFIRSLYPTRMRSVLTIIISLLFAAPAAAADFSVLVKNAAGQPVADAVVTLVPTSGAPHGPIKFDWPMKMAQKDIKFSPLVLVVPVGADVAFPNLDTVRHHVYSFSPAKRFELKLYGRDETRTVHFDKPGVVALGCNIHDSMVGFIKVVDTPYAAKTDASGHVVLHDVPAGQATLHVWHPYMKGLNNEVVKTVAGPGQGGAQETVVVDLRAPPPSMAMH